eukprot:m.86038 g.86038  ORF g.86038 m.86038 type:complete len:60 (-) comp13039_c0_seq2:844-1023(-)
MARDDSTYNWIEPGFSHYKIDFLFVGASQEKQLFASAFVKMFLMQTYMITLMAWTATRK